MTEADVGVSVEGRLIETTRGEAPISGRARRVGDDEGSRGSVEVLCASAQEVGVFGGMR